MALAVNASGQAAGWTQETTNADTREVLFWNGTASASLGTLGGLFGEARDLNDLGQIVGASRTAAGLPRGFLWDGGYSVLDPLSGDESSQANAIHNGGLIVGHSRAVPVEHHAVIWHSAPEALPTLGGLESEALDVNDRGEIVGWSQLTGQVQHRATLWMLMDPEPTIESIVAQVEALRASGVLNAGQTNSLLSKLRIAEAMLENDRPGPATHQLEAFLSEVDALVGGGVLTSAQGQELSDAVAAVIESLG